MFDLEDASGDGSIDIDEFTSVCSCYGLDASECKEAFSKMGGVSYFLWSHRRVLVDTAFSWLPKQVKPGKIAVLLGVY